MRKIKTFEGFFKSDSDESVKNTFEEIKENFNIDNLYVDKVDYEFDNIVVYFRYIQNNVTLGAVEKSLFNYVLTINGDQVNCSKLLKMKIYKYFYKKWKENDQKIKKFPYNNHDVTKWREELNDIIKNKF